MTRPGRSAVRAGVVLEHGDEDLPFVEFRVREGPGDRQPSRGADQVQPQSPEEPGVRGAVAVAGPSGQVRPLGGGPGPGALHRGRVNHPDRVGPQVGVRGQYPDQPLDQRDRVAQPLVVARLAGQIRKRPGQVRGHEPQPAGLGTHPEQGLRHRQGEQFGVGQPRWPPNPA